MRAVYRLTLPVRITVILALAALLLWVGCWTVFPRRGVLTIRGEGVYRGQMLGVTPHGQGVLASELGVVYRGGFRFGEFHGRGEITFADGSRLAGEFRNGMLHGNGTIRTAQGKVMAVRWREGKPVKPDKSDPGVSAPE